MIIYITWIPAFARMTTMGNMFKNFGISKEKQYFVENLSMLLGSGMSLIAALEAISQGMKSQRMKEIITVLARNAEEGSPIWRTLEHTGIFVPYVISLVRIGEESGKLTKNLKLIAQRDEKERLFRSKICSALMYPALVLCITLFVGVGIAWFILPRLSFVFKKLTLQLPLITRVLIGLGEFLSVWGWIVVPLFFLALGAVFYFLFFFSKTKFIGQQLLFHLPGVKMIIQEVEIARFGYLLGTLFDAGLPITIALDSLERATTFIGYQNLYAHIHQSVEEGNSFYKSFQSYPHVSNYIPAPIQQMIASAERSGNLSPVLLHIAEIFETKTDTTTKNVLTILETIMMVIVWLGVVGVALAVILPIYQLIGGLNTTQDMPAGPPSTPAEELPQPNETPAQNVSSSEATMPTYDYLTGSSTSPFTPTPTPTPTTTNTKQTPALKHLEILEGIPYVNVRSGPNSSSELVAKVNKGEVYEYTEKRNGWYRIILPDETKGWLNARYAKEVSNFQ